MCSPHKERSVFRVVVFVIILRDFDGQVFADITFVLTVKSHTIIFRMSHYKDLAATVCHCKEKPCFIGFSKHCQFFTVMDILDGNFRMSGMRCKEHIVESAYQRNLTVHHFMPEKTEHLLIKFAFFQSIVVVESCLCSPAQINGGGNMGVCPVHDLYQFLPVVYLFEFHLLYRSTCDDHSIVFVIFQFRKCLIKFIQMTHRCILRFMALYCHKGDIYLQRCVGKGTQKLKLCLLFQRHQVQNEDLNGADILMGCT